MNQTPGVVRGKRGAHTPCHLAHLERETTGALIKGPREDRTLPGKQVGREHRTLLEKLFIPGVFVLKMSQYQVMEFINKKPFLRLTQKE